MQKLGLKLMLLLALALTGAWAQDDGGTVDVDYRDVATQAGPSPRPGCLGSVLLDCAVAIRHTRQYYKRIRSRLIQRTERLSFG